MTDDNDRELTEKEALQEFRREFQSDMQRFQESIDASLRALSDCVAGNVAAMREDAEFSRRLEGMKLPIDQELMLYNLLTLPEEALELVRERLGFYDRQY
jgi:hypothetical protein